MLNKEYRISNGEVLEERKVGWIGWGISNKEYLIINKE